MRKRNFQLELEERFSQFLIRRSALRKSKFGPSYIKDKISRLRRLIDKFPDLPFENINDNNLLDILDYLCEQIPGKYTVGGKTFHVSKDYSVIIRYLYEMNTKKVAPKYTHYNNTRAAKYR